jgi:hypothetical protein
MHLQQSGPSLASARKVVLGSVGSALGQPGPGASVQAIAAVLGAELAAAAAVHDDLLPAQLTQAVEGALHRATQQLTSRGVSSDHVLNLVEKVRRELANACSDVTHAAAAAAVAR